ncbi:MAG: multiple sugar transport system ATP-binding protein [Paracoccaceae bacterium]|jgi:multiple sugar transport system ATP-binding protein
MTLSLKQEKQPKSEIEERVSKAVQMLDLGAYEKRFPANLSGGQRQRVAIGRATVREPKLFLFDEPLSNLDAALRMNTRIEIADLHRKLSASMIYVTHDQTEAMTLANKIVVLRDGFVEQVGSPMELYNNPDNKFVAGFLGSPSTNFLSKSVADTPVNITIGIRPEHLKIVKNGRINGLVTHVEQLGADTNILVATDADETLIVRLFGQYSCSVGVDISLDFDAANVFRFDANEQRI